MLRAPRLRLGLWHGVGAAIEHGPVLESLRLDGIRFVIDVGANVGQFTLAARHWLPEAEIMAFEPLPSAARRFRTLFAGDKRVALITAAVGEQAGELDLHVSRASDSSSLLPISPRQTHLFPGTDESHVQAVPVVRLDDVVPLRSFERRTLLKIDVQGFELGVLAGAEKVLDAVWAVYVECSFVELYSGQALAGEVIAWLLERGFALAAIGPIARDHRGASVQSDLLFVRADAKAVARPGSQPTHHEDAEGSARECLASESSAGRGRASAAS